MPADVPVGVDGTVLLPGGGGLHVWQGGDPLGRPVLFHSGTPSGRFQALQVHEAAVACGIRLICFNRPGYGAAVTTPPGLASVGADGCALRQVLGVPAWGVVGISGGGPYAVATAAADPDGVSRAMAVAGTGPRAVLNGPKAADDSPWLHELMAGRADTAWAALETLAVAEFAGLVDEPEEVVIGHYFDGAPSSDLEWLNATARARWVIDARDALQRCDGYVRDHLSWSWEWDVKLTSIPCPVALVYGEVDPVCPPEHGEWYASQIPQASMRIRPGAGHGTTCFTGWTGYFSWLTA